MQAPAKSLSSTTVLNDGVVMPMFGLGTYQAKDGLAVSTVEHSLKNGYRLLDTAEYYENESGVGKGIADSGLKREDVFVVTKVWDHGYDVCMQAFKSSLNKLDTGYVDLYLMHTPLGGNVVETYKAMQELKTQGHIRSVGVSNFGVHHLEGLKKAGQPTPSVNQIELHPWQRKEDIVKYCHDNGITVMGFSPLSKGQRVNDQTVVSLAEKYNKTPGQILIRWSVQMGYITIPKSSNPIRIVENSQVFDWEIDEADMKTLNSQSEKSCTWNPCTSAWEG